METCRAARTAHTWRAARSKAGAPSGAPPAPPRPYPDWLVHAPVARRRWDAADVPGLLRRGTPVILSGVPLTASLVGKWDFPYLAAHYEGPGLNVHFTPRTTTRFTRFYGEGAGEGGIIAMSFRDFAEVALKNERLAKPTWRYYLQALLAWSTSDLERLGEEDIARERQAAGLVDAAGDALQHAPLGARLEEDLKGLDYGWLRRACAHSACEGLYEVNLWAGPSGGCTPIHYDSTQNFLCQLTGRKRLLLFPPAQSHRLYPYPATHPMYAFAMVDAERPDLARFPAFGRAAGLEALLEPGDALFLPCHWWHYVKQVEGDETLSLNFWCGARASARADAARDAEARGAVPTAEEVDAAAAAAARGGGGEEEDDALLAAEDDGLLCMQLGRHVEREAIRMCGGAGAAAKFLHSLARGEDGAWPRDSRAAQNARELRVHLITALGERRSNALLRGLAHGGRLGLAPPLRGGVVGTEGLQHTPNEQLRPLRSQMLQKMMASGYIKPSDIGARK
ncbi:hypothetical protein AB1Y20_011730 [Prymnesium parvum]|uniref:JmjC domain-containing protein n=1 Tax=Prymnesium parvum TaxID=97485 RepID=A0AB34IJU7_PRYPA